MPAILIDGKSLAATLRAAQKSAVDALAARGVRPGLAAILAGNDAASRVYVRNKARACEETGVRSEVHEFPESVSESALLARRAAQRRSRMHGILVQLPCRARWMRAGSSPQSHDTRCGRSSWRHLGALLQAARLRAGYARRGHAAAGPCRRGPCGQERDDRGPLDHRRQAARAIALAKGRNRHHLPFEDRGSGGRHAASRRARRRRRQAETHRRRHGQTRCRVIDVGVTG